MVAVIVAAGEGRRMGGPVPKQFRLLGGVPLLLHSVRTFSAHPQIGAVVLVTDVAQAAALSLPAGVRLVPGGATRQASVRAGLAALAETAPEYVFIHDAARPFVTAAQISAVAAALTPDSGALLAVPVADTLKQAAPALPPVYCHPGESRDLWQEKSLLRHEIPAFAGMTEPFDSEKNKLMGGKQAAPDTAPLPRIGTTLPRDGLWAAQTPQAFPYALIEDAHRELADRDLTDDAALFEALGRPVRLVPGDRRNFKLTTPEDFIMAEALLAAALPAPLTEIRTGMGFDVHGFTDGDAVILGGVRVPHTHRLAGHSDADVALHALTDALLGAIGAGDIGQHFPPSDPQWRGRDSRHFLRHAVSLLAARGGSVVNADLTIICETPKIGPHRDAMRGVIAADLGVTPDRVNVKGTTTERLGFTGRGEGIAAQAVISVRLPV